MRLSVADKRAAFRALHAEGCFLLPNPWDMGSARILQDMGFLALGSTSAGSAWAQGHPDYGSSLGAVLDHLTALSEAVDLPINADFEGGFATDPQEVAANITRAIATGVAGISLEDRSEVDRSNLYDTDFHVERVRAARAAIDASRHDVMLVARTELMLIEPDAVHAAIDKLVAFAEAGADCVFAPGVKKRADIKAMVDAVAPIPLNVLVLDPEATVQDLAELGVRRLSLGPALARSAWTGMRAAAESLKLGSFAAIATGVTGGALNEIFQRFEAERVEKDIVS